MKRLNEVCKMVGVTRKTLQQYNDIGLLKPTVKTEGGYWLYDDESIQMLMTIQVFVEAGYKRAEIKPLLTAKQDELPEILTDAIEKLKAKRARIDGMINYFQTLINIADLPPEAFKTFCRVDLNSAFDQKNFKSLFEETLDIASGKDGDGEIVQASVAFWLRLSAVGALVSKGADSEIVQDNIKQAYESYLNCILQGLSNDEQAEFDTFPIANRMEIFKECVLGLLSEQEVIENLTAQCGKESAPFIKDAVLTFCEAQSSKKED